MVRRKEKGDKITLTVREGTWENHKFRGVVVKTCRPSNGETKWQSYNDEAGDFAAYGADFISEIPQQTGSSFSNVKFKQTSFCESTQPGLTVFRTALTGDINKILSLPTQF